MPEEESEMLAYVPLANQGIGLAYALTGVVGTMGNLLTIRTLWREGRAAWLHVQLALANICCLLTITLAAPAALKGRWLFGQSLCQGQGFMAYFGGYAEISLTCCICIETYIAFCHPSIHKKLTGRVFVAISSAIWLLALVSSMLPLYGWNTYRREHYGTSCGLDVYRKRPEAFPQYLLAMTFLYSIPVIAACICIVLLFVQRRRDSGTHEPLFKDREVVNISLTLLLVVVVCAIPYFLRVYMGLRTRSNIFGSFVGTEFTHIAMKLGCCALPFVYFIHSKHVKTFAFSMVTGVTPEKKNN